MLICKLIIHPPHQTMKVFEHYPEPVLLELSRYVLYDTFLTNVTCKPIIIASLHLSFMSSSSLAIVCFGSGDSVHFIRLSVCVVTHRLLKLTVVC